MEFEKLREEYLEKRNDRTLVWDVIRRMQEYGRSQNDDVILGKSLYYAGEAYYYSNNWQQSLSLCNESLIYLKDKVNITEVMNSFNLMGIMYNLMGNTIAAVDSYLNALNYSENTGNTAVLAAIYNNLANVYMHIDEYPEALRMLEKAAHYSLDFNLLGKRRTCVRIINFCYCYYATGQLDGLEKSYQELVEFCKVYTDVSAKEETHLLNIRTFIYCIKKERKLVEEGFCEILTALKNNMIVECISDLLMMLPVCVEQGYANEVALFLQGCQEILMGNSIANLMERYYRCCVIVAQKQNNIAKAQEMALQFYETDTAVRAHRRTLMVQSIQNKFEMRAMEKRYKEAEQHSITDTMTELYNRRALADIFNGKFEEAKQIGKVVGLVFADVDYFKQYNDTHGHVQGDSCLKIIADEIKKMCGEDVLSMRYGGDEFLLMFTDDTQQYIEEKLESLSKGVREQNLVSPCAPLEKVTVTMGVCIGVPERYDSLYDFILRADRALYRGKETRGSIFYY